jgi:hypothetical protein
MFRSMLMVFAVCVAQNYAQTYSISGKVSSSDGKPLAGVVVSLFSAQLKDTSGADGTYSLSGSAISIKPMLHGLQSIRLLNGQLQVQSEYSVSAKIRVYDVSGSLAGNLFQGRLQKGLTEIPLNLKNGKSLTQKKWIVQTQLGETKPVLIKSAAVDWMQATKAGFNNSQQSISANMGVIDFTMTPSTSQAPDLGPNVFVFEPTMPMEFIQNQIDNVYKLQSASQFGLGRYAFLFKPGTYTLNVDVGYYTQALGLGALPDDVIIKGSVRSIHTTANNNVTISFWRGAENLSIAPAPTAVNTWAVSQGVSMRRVHVKGSLGLSMGGWASGGFLADSKIDGTVNPGSQQQWFSRNTEMAAWSGGVWNMAFVGCTNPPAGAWPAKPFTVVDETPVVREKPYLVSDASGNFSVNVPGVWSGKGVSWANITAKGISLPVEQFYVAHVETDNASTINAALAQGKNLILTPGIYALTSSLLINRAGTVVLGIGLPTLVTTGGHPCLTISDVDGVKVAGLLIDAGPIESATLMQVGEAGSAGNHAANPTSLHDIYCRIGGGSVGTASSCVTINSSNVIVDHFWLWRADHGAGAQWTINQSRNGLIVNGNDVTAYGLFVEHFQEYQTLWNGERGRTYFYQSELPYDPPSQADWQHEGISGYASYKVANTVKVHQAWALGVYSAFRYGPIVTANAVETPTALEVKLSHIVSIWLNGIDGSGISNVINGLGGAATKSKPKATVD